MASSQIEQLRASFDKMSAVQQKQFIDKLKIQLQNNKSAEHLKFLQECVSKYNMAVRGGLAAVPTSTTSASSPVVAKSKQKNPLKVAVITLSVILVVFFIGSGVFVFSVLNNSSSNVVGRWLYENKNMTISLDLDKNGNYEMFLSESMGILFDTHTGTYTVNGNIISLIPSEKEKMINKYILKDNKLYLGDDSDLYPLSKVGAIDNSNVSSKSDNEKIAGEWVKKRSNNLDHTLILENDNTYKLIIPQVYLDKPVNYDYVAHSGTYEFKGTTLILYITYNDIGSAETEEYEIEFDNDKITFVDRIGYGAISKGDVFDKK